MRRSPMIQIAAYSTAKPAPAKAKMRGQNAVTHPVDIRQGEHARYSDNRQQQVGQLSADRLRRDRKLPAGVSGLRINACQNPL